MEDKITKSRPCKFITTAAESSPDPIASHLEKDNLHRRSPASSFVKRSVLISNVSTPHKTRTGLPVGVE